jgi:hypothetical protein
MVERGAHIDLFFRNGLKEYEVLPPSEVWDNIRPAIPGKQRSFFVLKAAAAVVMLVSLSAVLFLLARNFSEKFNSPAVSLNQEAQPKGSYVAKTRPVDVLKPNIVPAITRETIADNTVSVASEEKVYFAPPEMGLFKSLYFQSSFQKNNGLDYFSNLKISEIQSTKGIEIGFTPDLAETATTNKMSNRWSIGALATPAYYSKFSFDKNDASKDLIKSEKAAASYSGGVAFSYIVNKRISVQTGLYYSSLSQKVTGVSSYSGFLKYNDSKAGSAFMVRTSSGIITSDNNDIYLMDNTAGARVITSYTMDVFDPYKAHLPIIDNTILQNFNYLEIPFLVRYKIIDRKMDFDLVGGLSYNMLVNNSAYSMSGGVKYYIGPTVGLSPVTFSSSLGMGIEYSLSKRISLNLEPTFRYYITPLGGLAGSSIHPYSFGILSGFFYKF